MQSQDILYISPSQLRAARASLDWSAQKCADMARVGVASVRRAERRKGDTLQLQPPVELAIRTALESAGVTFLDTEHGPGVAFKPKDSPSVQD